MFCVSTVPLVGNAHDDARGVEVVRQSMPLSQKLGGEENMQVGMLLGNGFRVSDGNGRLDDHLSLRVAYLDFREH